MRKLLLQKIALLFAVVSLTAGAALAQSVPELIYYKFDSPGTTVQNQASSPVGTLQAPIIGGTIGGMGQFGTGLLGTGTSSSTNSVNTGWATNLGNNSWTISMWLNNIPSATGTVYFFGDNSANGFRAFTGGVADPGGIRLTGTGITPVDMANVVSSGPVVITYVYDATAGNIKGYVNGVLNVTVAQSALSLTGTGPFLVGGYSTSNNGLPAGGIMDEFRLYNRALSAAEISTTWNQMLPYTPSPIDAGAMAITNPLSPVTPGVNTPITVSFRNFGSTPFTSGALGFSVNGTVIQNNVAWTGNVAPQATATYTFSGHTFAAGTNNICFWVKVPGDTNTGNDTTCISVLACNAISGTYTINKNGGTTGNNFQSFAAAVQALNSCGVSGPVSFNVVAGSGPYNEQVTLSAIPGTSATNTVTFNGNSNILSFAPTTSNRAVIRLDGADHITINGLNIQATDPTYGWGIHLTNGADNNTISNNTITISSTSTTESNSSGIVFSTSPTSITAAGNSGNNNVITTNIINGGYKNVQVSGAISSVGNNQILNNQLRDSYADAVEINAANATLVQGNDISRPTRTVIGTAAGVTVSGGSISTMISKNRIHNTHDNETTPTGVSYGIYFTASDAPVGSENIAKNNVLYNFNSTGTIYGIYNTSSNGAFYYHNTIYLTNTANTGTVRGFYQTTSASNIKFINNIVYINAGTTGTKHALYFNTTASSIESNNNVLYVDPAVTTGHIGYYTTSHTTLAAWKAANNATFDQASVSANPNFVNPAAGNFLPANILVNNVGQALPAVTDDINGLARNATTPDPGAYEFSLSAIDAGITAITNPNSVCGLTSQENITITISNFGNTTLTSVPVSYQIGSNAPVTATFTGSIAPGASVTYTFTTPANLSATGSYSIVATANAPGDGSAANNSITKVVTNSRFSTLPQLNFETVATGIGNMRLVTNSRSAITEGAGASLGTGSTKGLILDGVASPNWVLPSGINDPWNMNPEHFAAAYICFDPAGGNPNDPLWLSFDLKQLFKTANVNTNFRVTVNGTPIGGNTPNNNPANTYRPPFNGTPIDWQKIYVDLTPYKNLPGIEIGFESSVAEGYANGTGTANLIDNIRIRRLDPTGVKDELLAGSVTVFPNPSAGSFTVSLPQGRSFDLEITDLTGKVTWKQTVKTNTTQIDLQQTAKGIYLLKITSEGSTATKKLVVQ